VMAMTATTYRTIFFHAHEAAMAPSRPLSSMARVLCLVREGGSDGGGRKATDSVGANVYTRRVGGG
jgi:hypothetical protein